VTGEMWLLAGCGVALGFVLGVLFTMLMLVPAHLWRRRK
jgi:hypothetical protein